MESPGSRPLLPHLRLDDLLGELQARLQTVLTTRDRVHALLEAVERDKVISGRPQVIRIEKN